MSALPLLDWRPTIRESRTVGTARHGKRAATIDARFTAWLAAAPHAYDLVLELARRYLAATKPGRKPRLSMAAIFERLRGDVYLGIAQQPYEWNNDFRAPMVRLIEQRDPEIGKWFETRERRA